MPFLSSVLIAVTVFLGLPAGSAAAKAPLRDVPEIADGIFTIVVANEIRRKCDDIDGRLLKGLFQIRRVKRQANDLGYSDKEIRALLDSKAEKARMIARGKTYMAGFGLDYDKPGDLCRLGRLEIKNNSAIGALLRAK